MLSVDSKILIAQIIKDYQTSYPDPLTIKKGTHITLIPKSIPQKWKGWHWCQAPNGHEGWICETFFEKISQNSAVTITDYTAHELNVSVGDKVQLKEHHCGWFCCQTSAQTKGWLPAEVIEQYFRVPSFKTVRLHLKPIKLSDAEMYEKEFSKHEIIQHLSDQVPWPYPQGETYHFLRNRVIPRQGLDRWTWGIYTKKTPHHIIGNIDLWREGKPEHRGFWLSPNHWNKGYMTEATEPITQYAFEALGFETLILSNAKGNIGSRRIKEKSGAKLIRLESLQSRNPEYNQKEIWELTHKAWLEKNKGTG